MSKNYLFQNYNYVEHPVNMKHVVIDILRSYNICIHMRDEPHGVYDMERFLYKNHSMGIPYHEHNIENCKRKIQANKERLVLLNSDSWVDKAYRSYYDEGLKEFNTLLSTNGICAKYKEKAERCKSRQKLISDFIANFRVDKQKELIQTIKRKLSGCIEALEEDYNRYTKESIKNDVTLKHDFAYSPMSKAEWVEAEKKKAEDTVNFCKKQIKEEEGYIEALKEKDKTIRAIFEALEPFDKEVM